MKLNILIMVNFWGAAYVLYTILGVLHGLLISFNSYANTEMVVPLLSQFIDEETRLRQ